MLTVRMVVGPSIGGAIYTNVLQERAGEGTDQRRDRPREQRDQRAERYQRNDPGLGTGRRR